MADDVKQFFAPGFASVKRLVIHPQVVINLLKALGSGRLRTQDAVVRNAGDSIPDDARVVSAAVDQYGNLSLVLESEGFPKAPRSELPLPLVPRFVVESSGKEGFDATRITKDNWCPMYKVRKRPVEVFATQLHEPFFVDTPEGRMTGAPGDWIVIDVKGERYPVRREIFERTYKVIEQVE